MSPKIEIPYKSDIKIEKDAINLLQKYNPEGIIPVPVEEIVELGFKISIIPTPGLENQYGIDSFITSDFQKIFIDEFCFMNQEERARFSIAHELAHKIYHEVIYNKMKISDEKSYIGFQSNTDRNIVKRMEIQAYRFAGFLLIPTDVLKSTLHSSVLKYGGIDNLSIENLSQITNDLKEKFFVSGDCLRRQIELIKPSFIRRIEDYSRGL